MISSGTFRKRGLCIIYCMFFLGTMLITHNQWKGNLGLSFEVRFSDTRDLPSNSHHQVDIYIQGPLWMRRKAFLCFCLMIRVNQISHLDPAGICLGFERILIIWKGNYDESSSSVNVGTLLNYVRSSSVLQVWFFVSFLVHCVVACANRMLLQSSCKSNKISFQLFGFI